MSRVRVTVRDVPGAVARAWLDNSLAIVRAVRAHPSPSTVDVTPPVLELIEAYLTVWRSAAESRDLFAWSADVDSGDLEVIATHWRRLAALTDDELASIGCHWAPDWTAPMYDALVGAFIDALAQDERTRAVADDLRAHPPGDVRPS